MTGPAQSARLTSQLASAAHGAPRSVTRRCHRGATWGGHVSATSAPRRSHVEVAAGDVRRRRRRSCARRGSPEEARGGAFERGGRRASTGGGGVDGDGRSGRRRRAVAAVSTGGGGAGAPVHGETHGCVRSVTGGTGSVVDTPSVPKARPGHGGELYRGGELWRQWWRLLRGRTTGGSSWPRERDSPGGTRWPLGA